MKIKYTNLVVIFIFLIGAFLFKAAIAEDISGEIPIFDEAAYSAQLEKDIKKLDTLYLRFHDKGLPSGENHKAKREYFKIARKLLHDMDEKFEKLDPKAGAVLSQTDILVINHVQVMLIDMLASLHESEWLAGDESSSY